MIDTILTIIPPWVIIALVVFGVVNGLTAYLILLERKIASWVQDRIGPNRVGPQGLLQPLADGLKMFMKEDYRSPNTDKWLFSLAPILMTLVVVTALAVIPWGGIYQGTTTYAASLATAPIPLGSELFGKPVAVGDGSQMKATYRFAFQIADVNIGILFAVAVLSIAVYGIVFGAWGSNNKFAFFGGMRAAAQMISYEVPLGLSILTIVLMTGTLNLGDICSSQAHSWMGIVPAWNIFCQPMAFVMFLICLHAEANRAPFDLAECEQELVGGYHTEFTSMRLGLLLLGEYTEMVVTSGILVALFLGGWHFPGLTGDADALNPAVTTNQWIVAVRCFVYFMKILGVISLFMWVRWSLPRFRYDQLMNLSWRAMVPIALFTMMGTAIVVYLLPSGMTPRFAVVGGKQALALLGMNVVLLGMFAVAAKFLPKQKINKRLVIPGSRYGNETAQQLVPASQAQ